VTRVCEWRERVCAAESLYASAQRTSTIKYHLTMLEAYFLRRRSASLAGDDSRARFLYRKKSATIRQTSHLHPPPTSTRTFFFAASSTTGTDPAAFEVPPASSRSRSRLRACACRNFSVVLARHDAQFLKRVGLSFGPAHLAHVGQVRAVMADAAADKSAAVDVTGTVVDTGAVEFTGATEAEGPAVDEDTAAGCARV
jgi:hypothetical protein